MIDLSVVIPAKASSTRIPNKNFREFLNGESLVDITVKKLLAAGLATDQIYLSCEDESKSEVAQKHGIQFSLRQERLCRNETPFSEVFRGVATQIPGDSDIMWAQVCDPFFDEYTRCIDEWRNAKASHSNRYDSLVVCHKVSGYYMDENLLPIHGWGFGPWHVPSQRLPTFYKMPFACSILTRDSIEAVGYYVGARPLWLPCQWTSIDIDTEDDFLLARLMMIHQQEVANR